MTNRLKMTIAAAALTLGLAGPQVATAQTELSLANFIPLQHVMNRDVFVPLAESIGEITNGEVTVQVYPSGELGAGPTRQYSRVIDGVADITFGVLGYTSSIFPRTLAGELPGLYADPIDGVNQLWNHFDLIADDYERVKVLAVWYNSPVVFLTRDRGIRSMEDLAGMTIRAPSAMAAEAIEAWGGNAVTMPVSDLYNAMQTGVIDGALIGADAVPSFRLQEVSSHATFGLPTAATTFFLLMNQDSWNRLTAEQQAAIDSITGQTLSVQATEAYQRTALAARESMEAAADYEIIDLDQADALRMTAMLTDLRASVIADLAGIGVDGEALLTALSD